MRKISDWTAMAEFHARPHLLNIKTSTTMLKVTIKELPEPSRTMFAAVAKTLSGPYEEHSMTLLSLALRHERLHGWAPTCHSPL